MIATPKTDDHLVEMSRSIYCSQGVSSDFCRDMERKLIRLQIAAQAVVEMLPHGPDRYELTVALEETK